MTCRTRNAAYLFVAVHNDVQLIALSSGATVRLPTPPGPLPPID